MDCIWRSIEILRQPFRVTICTYLLWAWFLADALTHAGPSEMFFFVVKVTAMIPTPQQCTVHAQPRTLVPCNRARNGALAGKLA